MSCTTTPAPEVELLRHKIHWAMPSRIIRGLLNQSITCDFNCVSAMASCDPQSCLRNLGGKKKVDEHVRVYTRLYVETHVCVCLNSEMCLHPDRCAFGGYSKRGKLCCAGVRAKVGTLFWKGPPCVTGPCLAAASALTRRPTCCRSWRGRWQRPEERREGSCSPA